MRGWASCGPDVPLPGSALSDFGASEKLMFWFHERGALGAQTSSPPWALASVSRRWGAWLPPGRENEESCVSLQPLEPGTFKALLRPLRIEVASCTRTSWYTSQVRARHLVERSPKAAPDLDAMRRAQKSCPPVYILSSEIQLH